MTSLGNYHHDFPLLAKQSGFYFHLHKGRVNWKEIENLNVNDIVESRNFQLLERNLINVINCNLEEEYDVKVSDKNFMKLFKIAQLGVDYLSYCEAYLDKCVVILQEQLIAFQEECESLKYEREKRREEGIRSERKSKARSYQCEKCDKAFISDVYLKFHDKRRHNIPNTSRSLDRYIKRCTDNSQQTEEERKSTISTQTSLLNDREVTTLKEEDKVKIKPQHAVKIENLEQEIQDLKERLKKAENALTDRSETSKSGGFPSPYSGPACPNTMLLLLPSYQTHSISNYEDVKPGVLIAASESCQQNSSQTTAPADSKPEENSPPPENPIQINTELETKLNSAKEGVESFTVLRREAEEDFECEKENADPNKEKRIEQLSKPLPPPRKSKKIISKRPDAEELSAPPKKSTQLETEAESFISPPNIMTSTPVKEKSGSDAFESSQENFRDLNKLESISNESLSSRKSTLVENSSSSFFKKIVRKNTPKFRTLGQNIRRSLTNLCDSVTPAGKENVKAVVVDGLNSRLRQLGVDPEWSGIPKKTMKQKLKALKHRRELLTKENPMYPVIRQNVEETIFQKLKKNLGSRSKKSTKNLPEQVPVSDDDPQDRSRPNKAEEVKSQRCVMYDIESDSESKTSDSEISSNQNMGEKIPEKTTVELSSEPDSQNPHDAKEFDLSVFQVGRGSLKKVSQKDFSVKIEELLTDSDTDDSENSFKALQKLTDKRNENDDDEQNTSGDPNLPRGTDEFKSTLQLNAKKKVWFVNNSKETGLSDSLSDDDDLWSLKSDWEKNVG